MEISIYNTLMYPIPMCRHLLSLPPAPHTGSLASALSICFHPHRKLNLYRLRLSIFTASRIPKVWNTCTRSTKSTTDTIIISVSQR